MHSLLKITFKGVIVCLLVLQLFMPGLSIYQQGSYHGGDEPINLSLGELTYAQSNSCSDPDRYADDCDFDDDGVINGDDLDDDNDGILDAIECDVEFTDFSAILAESQPVVIVNQTSNFTVTYDSGMDTINPGGNPGFRIDSVGYKYAQYVLSNPVQNLSFTVYDVDTLEFIKFEFFDENDDPIVLNSNHFALGAWLKEKTTGVPGEYTATNTTSTFSLLPNQQATATIPKEVSRVRIGYRETANGFRNFATSAFSYTPDINGDGSPNCFDTDSDGDGCFDALEAGHGEIVNGSGMVDGEFGNNGFDNDLETVGTDSILDTNDDEMNYSPTESNPGMADSVDGTIKGACEATITINKTVINDDNGMALSGDFQFQIDDAYLSGNTLTTIAAGNSYVVDADATYHIFEENMAGYMYIDTVCENSSGAVIYSGSVTSIENYVDVANDRTHVAGFPAIGGEEYTCTVSNNDAVGSCDSTIDELDLGLCPIGDSCPNGNDDCASGYCDVGGGNVCTCDESNPLSDCDMDGNPNGTDPNPMVPTVEDDGVYTGGVGTAGTYDILGNDDFMTGSNTSIVATGGTYTGTVSFDAITGEMTYTPDPSEEGTVVTVVYEVCNTEVTPEVCDTATVTINVGSVAIFINDPYFCEMPISGNVSISDNDYSNSLVTLQLTSSIGNVTTLTAVPDLLGTYSFDVSALAEGSYVINYSVSHTLYGQAEGEYDIYIDHKCNTGLGGSSTPINISYPESFSEEETLEEMFDTPEELEEAKEIITTIERKIINIEKELHSSAEIEETSFKTEPLSLPQSLPKTGAK